MLPVLWRRCLATQRARSRHKNWDGLRVIELATLTRLLSDSVPSFCGTHRFAKTVRSLVPKQEASCPTSRSWWFLTSPQTCSAGTTLLTCLRFQKGDLSEADEELFCKPPVWVDLPVWYPEKVAQVLRDWSFLLPTRQAHLSTLSVRALDFRHVAAHSQKVSWFPIDAPQKVSCFERLF